MRWTARTTEEWFFPMARPISGKLMGVWVRARCITVIRASETVRVRRDECKSAGVTPKNAATTDSMSLRVRALSVRTRKSARADRARSRL